MAKYDLRLQDATLLVLAGKRLQHRQAFGGDTRWQEGEGISALLAAARRLEPRGPWTLPSVGEPGDGMHQLLAEARQWQREHGHGTTS